MRLLSRTWSPAAAATERTLSHLNSNDHPRPVGTFPAVASMGMTGSGSAAAVTQTVSAPFARTAALVTRCRESHVQDVSRPERRFHDTKRSDGAGRARALRPGGPLPTGVQRRGDVLQRLPLRVDAVHQRHDPPDDHD